MTKLAKSTGETIISHSKDVEKVSLIILKHCANYSIVKNTNIKELVSLSALLHDIGKATENFQNKLKYGKTSKSNKFRHNEIGYAFLAKYLDYKDKNTILESIYWHHSISNKQNNHRVRDILDTLDVNDIDNMKQILLELTNKLIPNGDINSDNKLTPKFYNRDTITDNSNNNNLIVSFVRNIVISADRIVSDFEDKNIDIDVNNVLYYINKNKWKFTKNPYKNSIRYNKQCEIVDKITKSRSNTAILKAPAGFGKTLMGLLWNRNSNKKLIWVCPRNFVAESVYISILKEMEKFGFNASIELYLSSEVKKSNINSTGFESDIIVTNIDNYLKATYNNSFSDKLYLINTCDVIFDEYHELVSDLGLFSCFVSIMQIRHQFTNSKTLLMTATPLPCNYLWDTMKKKTLILPRGENHYPAQHNKKYRLILEDNMLDGEKNRLTILNSLPNIQDKYLNTKCDKLLIHSKFEDTKRLELFNEILNMYGCNKSKNKVNVLSTSILEASLDISFKTLNESVISPTSTLQRIGRCNRWGEYDGISDIIISGNLSEKGENLVRNILYSRELTNDWFNFLSENNKKHFTLNQLYNLYNKFNKEYSSKITKWINDQYLKSVDRLDNIFPYKIETLTEKTDIKRANSNKLRMSHYEMFIIVKKENGEFTEPFGYTIYGNDIDKEFGETNKTAYHIFKTIQNMNDSRYEYPKINVDTTIDYYRKLANKNNSPYIVFNKKYDEKLGLIKIK